jgi:hypothetical protein
MYSNDRKLKNYPCWITVNMCDVPYVTEKDLKLHCIIYDINAEKALYFY